MVMITQHAESIGLSPKGTTAQLIEMISKFHLPTQSESVDKDQLYQAITHDKKTRGNQLKIILLEKIGQAKIVTIPTEEIKNYL